MRLARIDGLGGQNHLQRPAFPNEARQALRAAKTGDDAELDFRLTEPGILRGQPQGAGQRDFAAAAEGEAVDGRNDGLAEVLDEIEHRLSFAGELGGLDGRDGGNLRDVGAGDECAVAPRR